MEYVKQKLTVPFKETGKLYAKPCAITDMHCTNDVYNINLVCRAVYGWIIYVEWFQGLRDGIYL